MSTRVLIAGVSTRAAAESAVRAGFSTTAIDAFADLDQHPSVRALTIPGPYSASSAAEASRAIECDAVVYGSGFENRPREVGRLAVGRSLWGNPKHVLKRARDPQRFFGVFRDGGHPVPRVWLPGDPSAVAGEVAEWLLKPVGAGGGHGVRPWSRRDPIPPSCYLQEFVPGESGSVAFVASGGRAALLGVSRQLIGDPAFGASGFQYSGSILSAEPTDGIDSMGVLRLAQTAASGFGLVGVNGIDFVIREGVPFPVEINPRWCASMELVERARGVSVFAAHAEACTSGRLPSDENRNAVGEGFRGAIGKAFVFASESVRIGDTSAWCRDPDIRDIPRPGARISAGRPVCTVFAHGVDRSACYAALRARSRQIQARLADWRCGRGGTSRAITAGG